MITYFETDDTGHTQPVHTEPGTIDAMKLAEADHDDHDQYYDYHQDEDDYQPYFDHEHSAIDVDFDYEDANEA
jgi:hypothetical protein